MKKKLSITCASLIATSMLLTACSGSAAPSKSKGTSGSWTPKSEIKSVIPSTPGGGSDTSARMTADIVLTSSYTPKSLKVNSMPGGSGRAAFSYMATKKGNDEVLMAPHNSQIMSTLVNKSPVVAADLTYLPVVAFDNLLLCINKNGKYKSVKEMIEVARANPGSVEIGGGQRGNTDHLCFEITRKYLDVDITYVQFNSLGETMSALLDGYVDFSIFNPSGCVGQVRADEALPTTTFADDHLNGQFAEVYTFEKVGYPDILVTEVRALSETPEMSTEAIAFYDEMIRKVTETERWETECIEKNYLTPAFMTSAEAKEFFDQEAGRYNSILEEVEIIQ